MKEVRHDSTADLNNPLKAYSGLLSRKKKRTLKASLKGGLDGGLKQDSNVDLHRDSEAERIPMSKTIFGKTRR